MFFVQWAFLLAFLARLIYTPVILLEKEFPNLYALTFLIFAIAVLLYMISVLNGPTGATAEGLMFQVTAQKLIVYCWIGCFFIQGYGVWKLIKN